MEIIYDKIRDIKIPDSEIIQDIEHAKCKDLGFDINLGNKNNWSLLMNAVDNRREELVRYLLSIPGINVNHRSFGGNTVLYSCETVSILKLLLNRRELDVNIQNIWGYTGLHRSCFWGRKACVKEYLLDARGDAFIRDRDGDTARDNALRRGYVDIAKIISNSRYTSLLRIPNASLCRDITRMIIEEYT